MTAASKAIREKIHNRMRVGMCSKQRREQVSDASCHRYSAILNAGVEQKPADKMVLGKVQAQTGQ